MVSWEGTGAIYGTVTQPHVGGVTESGGDAGEIKKRFEKYFSKPLSKHTLKSNPCFKNKQSLSLKISFKKIFEFPNQDFLLNKFEKIF